jgi:hypothetical protein
MSKFRQTVLTLLFVWLVALAQIVAVGGCFLSLFTLLSVGMALAYASSPGYADRDVGIGILLISYVVSVAATLLIVIPVALVIYKGHWWQRVWSAFEQRFLLN